MTWADEMSELSADVVAEFGATVTLKHQPAAAPGWDAATGKPTNARVNVTLGAVRGPVTTEFVNGKVVRTRVYVFALDPSTGFLTGRSHGVDREDRVTDTGEDWRVTDTRTEMDGARLRVLTQMG